MLRVIKYTTSFQSSWLVFHHKPLVIYKFKSSYFDQSLHIGTVLFGSKIKAFMNRQPNYGNNPR